MYLGVTYSPKTSVTSLIGGQFHGIVDGYIVAEKDNVLLNCKKEDSSDLIRKYITAVQISKGDEFI